MLQAAITEVATSTAPPPMATEAGVPRKRAVTPASTAPKGAVPAKTRRIRVTLQAVGLPDLGEDSARAFADQLELTLRKQ